MTREMINRSFKERTEEVHRRWRALGEEEKENYNEAAQA